MQSTPEQIVAYAKARLTSLFLKNKLYKSGFSESNTASNYLEMLSGVFPDNSVIIQMLIVSIDCDFHTELIPLIRNHLNIPDNLTIKEAIAYCQLLKD